MELTNKKDEIVVVDDDEFERFTASLTVPPVVDPEKRDERITDMARDILMQGGYLVTPEQAVERATRAIDYTKRVYDHLVGFKFLDHLDRLQGTAETTGKTESDTV